MSVSKARTRLWKALALFAVWTAYGLLSGWETHYRWSFSKHPLSWFNSFRYEMSYAYLWCLATPLVTWLSNRYRLERQTWPAHLMGHFLSMSLLILASSTLWNLLAQPPGSPFHEQFKWSHLFRAIESSFDTGLLLYWIIVGVAHAHEYYERYQAGLLNATKLQTQLVRAQLDSLKMQLHPHFLFNTLHTITALVHEDPELAEKTIARLSELLRLFLANAVNQEVQLREELRILDLYLEIERTRFGDRLITRYQIDPETEGAMIPSLILQPLVENAIRHGVGKKSGEAMVAITAERANNTLILRVIDNGVGLPPEMRGSSLNGVGLSITRSRLDTLYAPNCSLLLSSPPIGGVEARIVMPFRLCKWMPEEQIVCATTS